MGPVNPGLFLKIAGTGIIITKKGPGFSGTGTGTAIPVGHYSKTKTNWQFRAELKPSSAMPNFHIRDVFFLMDSIILHIILKVNKLNLFIAFYISIVLIFDICSFLMPRPQLPVSFGFTIIPTIIYPSPVK